MIYVAFDYNTARKFAKLNTTLRVFTKYRQPIYAHFQHLCSWERPLNAVKIVLDHPIINASSLIDAPKRIDSKILGISKKGENHSIHSFSCWLTGGLNVYYFHPVNMLRMETQ